VVGKGGRSKSPGGRRPLPAKEPKYAPGEPEKPQNLSCSAGKIWDSLVSQMIPTGVLRSVDSYSLGFLCEDIAMQLELRRGLREQCSSAAKKARKENRKLPGGALTWFGRTAEGRRTSHHTPRVGSRLPRSDDKLRIESGVHCQAGGRRARRGFDCHEDDSAPSCDAAETALPVGFLRAQLHHPPESALHHRRLLLDIVREKRHQTLHNDGNG
jgi:YD repeat-containing protein